MEEDHPKDGWEEHEGGCQQAEVGFPPKILAIFSSLLSSHSLKQVRDQVPKLLFQAHCQAQGSHQTKKAAPCLEPEEVQHIVVVVKGGDGGDKNIDRCENDKDQDIEDQNVDLKKARLPGQQLSKAPFGCLFRNSCLCVADWEEEAGRSIEEDWSVLLVHKLGCRETLIFVRPFPPRAEDDNVSVPTDAVGLVLAVGLDILVVLLVCW